MFYDFFTSFGQATANCTINGRPATAEECSAAFDKAAPVIAGVFIPLFLILLACTVFWVITLIHALKHPDVPNRTLWIILHFIFLGVFAGPIYYFAVKRPYDKRQNNAAAAPSDAYAQNPAYPIQQPAITGAPVPQPQQPERPQPGQQPPTPPQQPPTPPSYQ